MTTTNVIGPGSTVGSYRLVKQIGVGGMGVVFEAVHTMLDRRVAIKVLHAALLDSPGMASRMAQEAEILDDVKHPGIVRIFDCGLLDDNCPWIAMELVSGESLHATLLRKKLLSPEDVCKLVMSLADVLATVHARGVVHRDLKPDNILFADGECPLRIIDWGVARLGSTPRFTLDGLTFGTPTYMSPEQVIGRDIAAPCDIYSLGVIAYEALTGHPPHEGKSLVEIVSQTLHGTVAPLEDLCPGAPSGLCRLVHAMLDKVAGERPTAAEVRDAMRVLAVEILARNPEFELYELTATVPLVGTTTRMRWTPAMPGFPTMLGYTMIRPNGDNWEVSGEIVGKD